MQKKIIALAVAAAFTVPAMSYAAADVYGIMHASIDMVNDGEVTNSKSTNQLNSNRSRVGLKGSEDLGNGLSAIWQAEGTVMIDNGGFNLNRNTFLGLATADMGTVLVGRHDTPYKMATRKLDVFKDTQADTRDGGVNGLGGMLHHDQRLNNVIAYISPDFSGLTVAAATVFGAESSPTTTPSADKKGTILSLAGMYNRDNIYAALAYQSVKLGDLETGDAAADGVITSLVPGGTFALDDEAKALKLGGGYTMDQVTVNAVVEQNTFTPKTGSETKGTNMYIGGKFAVSDSDAVKLAYTLRGETETGSTKNNDKASQVSVGYDHSMSAHTSVYALYSKVTEDATGAADPSVVSFGMKHSF